MKLNKILTLFLAGMLVFPIACSEEDLNQINTNTISTENFWRNADDVRLAVNGMFHPIANTFFWGRILHTGAVLRSDEFNIRPFGINTTMSTFQGEPGTSRWATEPFQEGYKSIFRANAVLENTNAENVPDTDERNSLVGQAHFMRGYVYWYLLHLYGNIPLVTQTPQGDADFFPSQAPREAVYDQIEADFRQAADLLPDAWEGVDQGRPTSGSAIAMLGKTHLYQREWSEADAQFARIMDGRYALLPGDRYLENFTTENENNEENVFSLQYLGRESFAWGTDIPGVGTLGTYHIDYAPPAKSPDQSHFINPWIRDLFEANGETIRRDATLAYDYPGSTGYGGVPFLEDFDADLAVAEAENRPAIFTRKYAGMEIGTRDQVDFLGTNVGNDWRIVRYADVLLMKAEAMNESGDAAGAAELVNMVRMRAEVDPIDDGMSQEDMRQAIIDERVLELTGESHRFFDLVRWDLADDYLGPNSLHSEHPKSLSGGVFQSGKHELVWIPQSEIDANPNLVQNPGY